MTAEVPRNQVILKLIFANCDAKRELTIKLSTPIKELKKIIVESYWPEGLCPVENVDHIRLVCSGRELEDVGSLQDANVKEQHTAALPIPVHVMPVKKGSGTSKNLTINTDVPRKEKNCFCCIS